MDKEVEEAAASLEPTAGRLFRRVILPTIFAGCADRLCLAFARAVGEYGSVVFISGNMPMRTEITPLLIITKLEQYDYAGRDRHRRGHAGVLVALLLAINLLAEVEQQPRARSRWNWLRGGSA